VLLIRDHFSAAAFGQQLAPFTALADAAGIGFDPAGQRIGRLDESLGIIRALLDGTPVRHRGAYQIDGLALDVLPGANHGIPGATPPGPPRCGTCAAPSYPVRGRTSSPLASPAHPQS
jgi:hypothetical protein